MTYVRAIIALLALGSTPLLACPAPVRVVSQSAALVATPLYIPTYGASYQYQQTSGATDDLLRQLLEEIRGMRAEMRALQGNSPTASIASGKAIVEASCISCHQPALAAKKGTDFLLVDGEGNLAALSPKEKARINARVAVARNMPPGKALPPDQAKAVVCFLSQSTAPPPATPAVGPPTEPLPKPAPLSPSLTPKEAAPKQEKP